MITSQPLAGDVSDKHNIGSHENNVQAYNESVHELKLVIERELERVFGGVPVGYSLSLAVSITEPPPPPDDDGVPVSLFMSTNMGISDAVTAINTLIQAANNGEARPVVVAPPPEKLH